MQEFTTFDMVIVGVSIILGLKGLFRGFIKEVFGLVGIIGGIFIASRLSEQVGTLIKPILGIQSEATLSLIGFIAALIGFWLVIYIISSILSKVTEISGLGFVNRILGFVFGTGKIVLIVSVIIYALYQIQAFKTTLDEKFKNSITFPYLVKTGGYIVKLDTSKFTSTTKEEPKAEEVIKEKAQQAKEKIEEVAVETKKEATTLGDKINEATSEAVEKVKDTATQIIKDNMTQTEEKK